MGKTTKKTILWIIIAIVVVGGVWYLTGSKQPSVEKESIKIGVILPLTGTSADAGGYIKNGLLLAQEELNLNSSLKYRYGLVFEDSHYSPMDGVTVIRKFIDIDKCKYIVGAYSSSVTLAVAPVAEESKVLLITPGSQSDEISVAGDYIFRTQINTAQEAKFLSDFIYNQIGSRRLAVLVINTAYGESVINNFSGAFKALGGNLGVVQKFDSKETDFRSYLLKIKDDGAEYVLMGNTRKQGAQILKQAYEMRLPAKFFGTSVIEGKELIEIAGFIAEGLIYPYPYDETSDNPSQKQFQEKYLNKYGTKNEMLSANGYDTLYLLSYCAEKVGNNTDRVKDCLYQIEDYQGASGILTFDENGDISKPFVLKTVKNGQFVPYED